MSKSKLRYIGQPNTILAIDASTNSMAFSVFTERKLIKYGKVNFYGNHVYEKTGDAAKKISAFLKDYQVDAIVIESAIYKLTKDCYKSFSCSRCYPWRYSDV